jgi:hypothetical protein
MPAAPHLPFTPVLGSGVRLLTTGPPPPSAQVRSFPIITRPGLPACLLQRLCCCCCLALVGPWQLLDFLFSFLLSLPCSLPVILVVANRRHLSSSGKEKESVRPVPRLLCPPLPGPSSSARPCQHRLLYSSLDALKNRSSPVKKHPISTLYTCKYPHHIDPGIPATCADVSITIHRRPNFLYVDSSRLSSTVASD